MNIQELKEKLNDNLARTEQNKAEFNEAYGRLKSSLNRTQRLLGKRIII